MVYIYAPSMATVVFALRRWKVDDLNIITYNETIKKFCDTVQLNCIEIIRNLDFSYNGLKQHKQYIVSFSKTLVGKEIVFCYYGFDYWGLFLIRLLNKTNKIYFSNLDFDYPKMRFKELISMRKLRDLIILRMLTGNKLYYYKISDERQFVGGDALSYLKKYHKPIGESEVIFLNNAGKILAIYKLPEYNTLFIDQGNVLFSVPNDVISVIGENVRLLVKPHPTISISNSLLIDYKRAPQDIPAEILMADKISISIGSTALINSMEDNNISLIHLVKWKSSSEKENLLKKLPSNIEKPDTLHDLKELLKGTIKYS